MNSIMDTRGLIIDQRKITASSTNIALALSDYLFPRKTAFVKITRGSINNPGTFSFDGQNTIGLKNANSYKGKVIILINEYTQSSMEYGTMALSAIPHAIVIGSNSAGANGNVSRFSLPGGINTQISGIGIYYPDGRETQRFGITPDIEVKPTIEGIRLGKDEVLEKAIEIINKK
jgi:C-terminal processing protease CtpA/Prc